MSNDLNALRQKLDGIDRSIVELLADRQRTVGEVARAKLAGAKLPSSSLRDMGREEDLLTRIVEHARGLGLDGYFVTRLFREIMNHSLRSQVERLVDRDNPDRAGQQRVVVGFQGTEGAYSHLAARNHFSTRPVDAQFVGFDSFRQMLDAVRDGRVDYAMLPVENTTAGSINEAYDLLARTDLAVVGEELQEVDHCLLALENVPVSAIRRVYSHPAAIDQCTDFLRSLPNVHVESYTDTAMSARKVRDDGDLSQAAIASEEAARVFGLRVIKRGICNQRENFTRMMVVARSAVRHDARIPCKTSVILATRHEEGALLRALNVLADHHLNLTKLESRPRPGTPWQYLFYVDFEGNLAEERVDAAMKKLAVETSYLKILGSYPARTTRENKPADPRPAAAGATGASPAVDPAARASRARDTVVRVGPMEVGAPPADLFAGPGRTVSAAQIMDAARRVKESGGRGLWGGAFAAGGADGEDAAPMALAPALAEAASAYGLACVAEALSPGDAAELARHAHVIRIGAGSLQNHALLRELGRLDKPVMLTRGGSATLDDWLAAAGLVMSRGNQQVILCDEGVRGVDGGTRRSLDAAALAELRRRTHLPVLVDPTLAAPVGDVAALLSLCGAALAVGAAGVFLTPPFADDPAALASVSGLLASPRRGV